MQVLDLFCGCGGLALGFAKEGFSVRGIDINPKVKAVWETNKIGTTTIADLKEYQPPKADLIIGGPPCKPFSPLNLTKRNENHPDFSLIEIFFEHVRNLKPFCFVFENVPNARNIALKHAQEKLSFDYNITHLLIRYSDYGAATKRRRLFIVGIRQGNFGKFLALLSSMKKAPKTVREALENIKEGDLDHQWSNLKTIHKYLDRFQRNKFNFTILKWDEPAPSFGNPTKGYILHPDSFVKIPPRLISVREALNIMGFPQGFHFPEGMSLYLRYQMVVDAVSPVFSRILARAIKEAWL